MSGMMEAASRVIGPINGFSAAWGAAMFRASWQGAMAVAVAWALVQTLARRSGRVQSWCWRLAVLKFAVALVVLVPLAVPVLPAPRPSAGGGTPIEQSSLLPGAIPLPAGDSALPQADSMRVSAAHAAPASVAAAGTGVRQASLWQFPSLDSWLLVAWLGGVMMCLVRCAAAWRSVARMRRQASVLDDPAMRGACAALCRKMGLGSPPALLSGAHIASPQLIGILRPAILLPAPLPHALPREGLEMILAHELAHLKRRDLFWNALHWAIDTLFFFHPLLWLARRPVRLAQELACDELALAATGAPAGEYGKTLLDLLKTKPAFGPVPMSVGVVNSASTLRRRLLAMMNRSPWSSRKLALAGVSAALLAAPGIIPWRLVARAAPADTPAQSPAATAPAVDREAIEQLYSPESPAASAPAAAGAPSVVEIEDQQQKVTVDNARVEFAEGKINRAALKAQQAATVPASEDPEAAALAAQDLADARTELEVEKAILQQDQLSLEHMRSARAAVQANGGASVRADAVQFQGNVTISNPGGTLHADSVEVHPAGGVSMPVSAAPAAPAASAVASGTGGTGDASSSVAGVELHGPASMGTVEAPTADIRVPEAATLKSVLVKPGQQVKKGDELFELDDRDARTRVAVDEARVALAQEQLKTAQREQQMHDAGVVGEPNPSVGERTAEVKAVQAALDADQAALNDATIRAPIDGTVTNFDLTAGVFVDKGSVLTQIINTSDLRVSFGMTPRNDVKSGQKIIFHLAGKEFPGEITYVSPSVDIPAGTYQVAARLTGDTAGLRPGTFGEVTLKN